jgi:nitrite reductase (NADH) large subunit
MKIVVIGNGVAGIFAARTVRELSPDAEIEVFTEEAHHYYFRPKLIGYIAGSYELNELYTYPESWYEKRKINIHLGQAITKLDPARKTITLNGGSISYDKLLLAIGSRPFLPPIAGNSNEGIFTLRTIGDASVIKECARSAKKAVVVGGGLLGLETAWALGRSGVSVVVIEYSSRLLPRQLDEEGASVLLKKINELGINVFLNSSAEEFLGDKKISGVRMKDGSRLEAGLVIVSTGVRSNLQLAADAGIKVNKGVVVDNRLKTSQEDIYAAGDCAEFNGIVYGIIPPAMEQAKIAAANIVGANKIGDPAAEYHGTTPTTTLKVMGIDLSCLGVSNPEGNEYELVKKVDREKGVYKKLVLKENRIVGALWLGAAEGVTALNRLINEKTDVSRIKTALVEDGFDFNKKRG